MGMCQPGQARSHPGIRLLRHSGGCVSWLPRAAALCAPPGGSALSPGCQAAQPGGVGSMVSLASDSHKLCHIAAPCPTEPGAGRLPLRCNVFGVLEPAAGAGRRRAPGRHRVTNATDCRWPRRGRAGRAPGSSLPSRSTPPEPVDAASPPTARWPLRGRAGRASCKLQLGHELADKLRMRSEFGRSKERITTATAAGRRRRAGRRELADKRERRPRRTQGGAPARCGSAQAKPPDAASSAMRAASVRSRSALVCW